MKIGDRVFVRGYIDEIRKDTVIIRNAGGYFGTIPSEVITGELPPAQPERKTGKWTKENACEFCGFQPWFERDIHTLSFCPNCGADMREEVTNDLFEY